jgi:hypothetical protein
VKIALLTAIWQRPRITRLFLDYYEGMPVDTRFVVGSEDPPESENWSFLLADNNPLSLKWQSGLNAIHGARFLYESDAVMTVGSDDFLTPQYIEACRYLLAQGAELIEMDGAYFHDTRTGRTIWANALSMGMGRCYSRALLDRLDWQLWTEEADSGLDSMAMIRVLQEGGEVKRISLSKEAKRHGIAALDVKTGENIWSMDHVKMGTLHYEAKTKMVLERHFPYISDQILNWEENGDEG